jgi:hypothetical protein
MQRHLFCRVSTLLIALINQTSFIAGQNQGAFQAAVNYPAGPPTVASNTGYLFGGIAPVEVHTRDSNGRPLDFDADGKPDVVIAANCSNYPGCSGQSAVSVYLSNGDGTLKPGIATGLPLSEIRSMAVGDFNGDGRPDVVVASDCLSSQDCSSGSLTILLGNPDGTFAIGANYPLGGIVSQANTVAVADFNGDGKPDIAVGLACFNIVVNGCSVGAVTIFLGNADGTFSDPTAYQTVGNSANYLTVGDFNRDGKLDIIAGSATASGNSVSTLTILLGVGDGNFTSQQSPNLPFYGLSAVAAVDLNSDGNLDLAMTSGPAAIQVLTGNGDGTFLGPVTYNTGLGNAITNGAPISVVDLNGDGMSDLIVSGTLAGFNGVQVFLNDGSGNLIPGATYTAGGWEFAPIDVADFNGDGKMDLAVVSGCAEDESAGGELCPSGTLTLLLGNGDGSLRSARYLPGKGNSGGYSVSVAAADMNGDGFQDLVFPGCTPGNSCSGDGFTLLLSDGAGGYQAPQFFSSSPASGAMYLAVSDFNGDGRPDIALFDACDQGPYNCAGDAISVFLNTGNATFAAPMFYESGGTGMSAQTIVTGNFHGIGKPPDIALLHCCTSDGQNLIGILLNNGDGTFQLAVTTPVASGTASWIAAADFNRDGWTDLAVAESTYNQGDPYSGTVQILLSNGDGNFTDGGSYNSGGDRSDAPGPSVITGDVNGDGMADIVVGHTCDQRVYSNYFYDDINCTRGAIGVLLGNGDGTFHYPAPGQTATVLVVPDGNFTAISLADVNGDGKLDVVASTLTGIYVAFGNGDGTLLAGTNYAALRVDQNVQLAIADLNGDGVPDIVQPGDNGQLAILYNQVPQNSAIPTTTTINAPAITYGTNASVTVTVTSAQGTLNGNVSLTVDNGAPASQTLSGGSTTFTSAGLAGGSHGLSATYAAQGNFAASSATGSLQVNQAQPSVSFTGAPASAGYHSTFTVTATTNASTTASISASGSCSVSGTTVTITSGTGTCNLTANWPADNNYLAASASQSTAATKAASTTAITSNTPNPSVTGQAVTVSYSVTASGTPTGNVTVTDGTGDACTATVAAGKCALTPTTAGAKTLTASYAGDSSFSSSTSAGITQTVNKAATTTTITYQAPNPSVPGQPVMIKFQVAPVAPGGGTAGGNVTVSDGLGDNCTDTVARGYCLVGFAAWGSKTVTVSYAGDGSFSPSTSPGVTHNVIDFSMSASPLSQSIKAGQKATYTITVTPLNGFTGQISLGCTDLPQNSTCSFSSNPIVITGPKSVSSKVTVQTSKSTSPNRYTLVFSGTLGNGVPQAGGILHYLGLYPNIITLTVN